MDTNLIWSEVQKIRADRDLRNKLVRPAVYEKVQLDPKEYRLCSVCKGKTYYLERGDAHRSGGYVPCYYCEGGTIRSIEVMVKKPVYRVKAPTKGR